MKLTKSWILDAAQQLFAQKGYTRTTTKAIADLAGVSESTLFRNYPTKEDLLNDLLYIMTPGPEDIPMQDLTNGEDLKKDFRILLSSHARMHIRHLPVFRLSMHVDKIYDQARFSKIQGMITQTANYLRSLEQNGILISFDYRAIAEQINALVLVKANEFVCGEHFGISIEDSVMRFSEKYAVYYAELLQKK